jgi:hypothetical protein
VSSPPQLLDHARRLIAGHPRPDRGLRLLVSIDVAQALTAVDDLALGADLAETVRADLAALLDRPGAGILPAGPDTAALARQLHQHLNGVPRPDIDKARGLLEYAETLLAQSGDWATVLPTLDAASEPIGRLYPQEPQCQPPTPTGP